MKVEAKTTLRLLPSGKAVLEAQVFADGKPCGAPVVILSGPQRGVVAYRDGKLTLAQVHAAWGT